MSQDEICASTQFLQIQKNQLIDLQECLERHCNVLPVFGFNSAKYKTSETKGFFPYEWFEHPDKMQNTELPPYVVFYSKVRSCNPLEADYTDYVNLLKSGLATEQAVVKLKLSKPPHTGIANYQNLQKIWKQEQMSSFTDFLR